MKTIIAEKPSVARDIAAIVGANNRKDGYLEGNGYAVTWAFGHLIQLAMPDAYGFTGFKLENLPIIPKEFILNVKQKKEGKTWKADEGVVKQLKIIENLFNSSDSLIIATDAGREGELIFRYIYSYIKSKKPFQRLWISSLTEKAIKEGLASLKDGKAYDNLFLAAKARSEADWLVGINSSQALSISANKGTFSLGRVQTPTLAMICKRYLENKNFVSSPFWTFKIKTEKDNVFFHVTSQDRYEDKQKAVADFELIQKGKLEVIKVTKTEKNEEPPLLYDLTTLQKEANKKLNLSADETLSIAQALYEAKLITYPRTGSRYVSDDVFETLQGLIENLKSNPKFSAYANTLTALNKRSCDASKVTDHHALLITEIVPKNDAFKDEKQKAIYNMIAARLLEAASPKCVKDVTKAEFIANGQKQIPLSVSGTIIRIKGWRAVLDESEDEEQTDKLPDLKANDTLLILKSDLVEGKTKPKDLLTESSLLSLMETCGKDIENEEERAAIKNVGIGTPATRAAIIETLFTREYITRQKKSLIPTEKGLTVYETVKDKLIADVSMTGRWENALAKIESGEMQAELFNDEIIKYTQKITQELAQVDINIADDSLLMCPKCKETAVKFYPKVVKCTKCDLAVFRNKSEKNLTDAQITKLLTSGKTATIKGFKSKSGKPFDAALVLDAEFKVIFNFD